VHVGIILPSYDEYATPDGVRAAAEAAEELGFSRSSLDCYTKRLATRPEGGQHWSHAKRQSVAGKSTPRSRKASSRRSERVWIEKAFLASSVRRSVRTASDRGELTMACGTGKTLVGLLVAEARTHAHAFPRTLALAICPDAARVNRERQARLRYLAVCSDETVVGEHAVVSRTCEVPERGPNDAAR
jgi:hypothetical protein